MPYPSQYAYAPPGPAPGVMYASFGRRVGGYVLDAVITGIPTVAILWPKVLGPYVDAISAQVQQVQAPSTNGTITTFTAPPLTQIVDPSTVFVWYSVVAVFLLLYYMLTVGLIGGTLGQRIVGTKVVRAEDGGKLPLGRAFLRSIIFWIGSFGQLTPVLGPLLSVLLLVALLWVAWDPRKQGLHDKLAQSFVVHPLRPVAPGYGYPPVPGGPPPVV